MFVFEVRSSHPQVVWLLHFGCASRRAPRNPGIHFKQSNEDVGEVIAGLKRELMSLGERRKVCIARIQKKRSSINSSLNGYLTQI
jgi:hypothetical protein